MRALEPVVDYDLAARFVDMLARLHSRWWNSPDLGDDGQLSWVRSTHGPMLPRQNRILSNCRETADFLSCPRGAATPRRLHDAERLRRGFAAMIASGHNEPMVLAHGDPHLSNLFVDAQGNPGLMDWTCLRSPWALDVTYFLGGCLDILDRRRWEVALLEVYRNTLAKYGVLPPSFDQMWLAYRKWHVYGFMVWLVNTTEYHTEAQITAMTTRYAAAVLDHESLQLLEV